MYRYKDDRILKGFSIGNVFEAKRNTLEKAINGEPEDYILNVDAEQYVTHLTQQYSLTVPVIHFENAVVDMYEDDVPAEYHPFNFNVYPGKSYKREILQFLVPCSGDTSLLKYSPANSLIISSGGNFRLKGDEIIAEYINFTNNAEDIKAQYNREVAGVMGNYETLQADIRIYNEGLKNFVQRTFNFRKEQLLARRNLLGSLGVPLKKKDTTPSTFSVPKPALREKITVKPVVHEKGFKPEPTLSNEDYRKILKLIQDVGKNFERMPSVYHGKSEEDLRDHILMILDPNFEMGSASGETFNKKGKTDIQLRYDSSVVFIAECKFWKGEKGFLETIDQLLGYLTWRDTKASVIVFVNSKDFSAILDKITPAIQKHSNYIGADPNTDESWFNFRVHINGDKNRLVRLAVQLFHLPD